jgi:hypothetical protein
MTPIDGAKATRHAPASAPPRRARLARRVPILSIRKPPSSTAAIAAKLYMLYIVPIAARSAWSASMIDVSIAPTLS